MIRIVVECILINALLLCVLLLLFPFIAVFSVLKFLERNAVRFSSGAVSLPGQDSIWQQPSAKEPLIITVLLEFEDSIGKGAETMVKDMRRVLLEKMVHAEDGGGVPLYPRCHCFIRPGYFQYFLEEDKSFSIDNHVFLWEGEVPSSKEALEDIVSQLSSNTLTARRSPWEFWCIPTSFDQKSIACVLRMHHSMADGISLAKFLITKLPDQAVPQPAEPMKFGSTLNRALLTVKGVLRAGRFLIKLVTAPADDSLLHSSSFSGTKKLAWSGPLDLERVKKVKNATGTTVNDVLMACLSGAMRKYMQKSGVRNPNDVTALLPFHVQPSQQRLAFENNLAVVVLKLPVGAKDAAEQLEETKLRMDEIKASGEALGVAWAMKAMEGLLPKCLMEASLSFTSRKTSVLVSNVPGPAAHLSICGRRLEYVTFWPPLGDNVGMGVSIFSYGGKIRVGVQSDVTLLPQPRMIIDGLCQALEDLET